MPPYTIHNPSPTQPPLPSPLPKTFTLRTPSATDIWRKPPSTNKFNAPHITLPLPLSTLRSARVTVSAAWDQKFDQGGLILILPPKGDKEARQWIKTGIEFFSNQANISTVACDRWADWSLATLQPSQNDNAEGEGGGKAAATVEIEREVSEDGERGSTLWVYSVEKSSSAAGEEGERRRALREISWVFGEEIAEGECEVGVYVAKPIADDLDPEKELEVRFEDLRVETW